MSQYIIFSEHLLIKPIALLLISDYCYYLLFITNYKVYTVLTKSLLKIIIYNIITKYTTILFKN